MKINIELNLDNEAEFLGFQMLMNAESIFFAIKNFDESDDVDQTVKDLLFEKFSDQKAGLLDLLYRD